MYINTECITLRMFSGMHLGAEISLCAGSYIIGRDNSCDIILQDQSIEARHVQLNISCIQLASSNAQGEQGEQNASSYRVEVHVKNLDGNISYKDEVLNDDASILMQEPYMLGQVCFAWFKYGESEHIASIQDELQAKVFNIQTLRPNMVAIAQDSDLLSDNNVGIIDNQDGTDLQNAFQSVETVKTPRWRRYVLLAIIFILLLGITLTIRDNIQTNYNDKVLLEKTLSEKNFPSLSVGVHEGMIAIQGLLANNSEFSRLTSLVQNMHFPVYLDVEIESDLIAAMIKKLNHQSLYPLIDIKLAEKELSIRMYLKDELIFNGLKIQLQELFSVIQDYKAIYNIHYADEIELLLNKKIDATLKKKINFEFLPGVIKIIGNLTNSELSKIKTVISEIGKQFNIVLVYDYLKKDVTANTKNLATAPLQAVPLQIAPRPDDLPMSYDLTTPSNNEVIIMQMPGSASQADNAAANVTYEFKVTSVNLSPISYVILANEQRVFRGGLLPGGYILTDIKLDVLTLEKNGHITNYYLNDSNN